MWPTSRPPRRRAEPALELRLAMRIEAAKLRHDGRADVHRRSLAPDGEASHQTDQRDRDLPGNDAQAEEPSHQSVFLFGTSRMQRRYHLRNAAALAARKPSARQKQR